MILKLVTTSLLVTIATHGFCADSHDGRWEGHLKCGAALLVENPAFSVPVTMIVANGEASMTRNAKDVHEELVGKINGAKLVLAGSGSKDDSVNPWETQLDGTFAGDAFKGVGVIRNKKGYKARECSVSLANTEISAGSTTSTVQPTGMTSAPKQVKADISPLSPRETIPATSVSGLVSAIKSKADPAMALSAAKIDQVSPVASRLVRVEDKNANAAGESVAKKTDPDPRKAYLDALSEVTNVLECKNLAFADPIGACVVDKSGISQCKVTPPGKLHQLLKRTNGVKMSSARGYEADFFEYKLPTPLNPFGMSVSNFTIVVDDQNPEAAQVKYKINAPPSAILDLITKIKGFKALKDPVDKDSIELRNSENTHAIIISPKKGKTTTVYCW